MVTLRPASERDAALLAALNQQLIRDERSRNPMTLPELEQRMRGLLAEGWAARLFVRAKEVCGYALFHARPDTYFPERAEVYLRQFFVLPERRGAGVGRAAFEQLMAQWPPGCRIVLDVLETNPGGLAFWRRLGFAPYAATLTRQHGG